MIYKIALVITAFVFSIGFTNCEQNAAQEDHNSKDNYLSAGGVPNNLENSIPSAIVAPKLNPGIHFCNELVPLEQPFVYEELDREILVNMYWQSQTIMFIKRAKMWFPIIEPILAKNNIPDDFKYLAVIESGLMNVTSPSGAKGFWQFMPATAIGYNMEVNEFVDERYELEIATQAACIYLKEAHKKFNNWTLAAASYNMGKAGLERRLIEQGVDSYYDLLLNQETARYAYRIIAVKEILANPTQYGFSVNDYYSLPTYDVVEVDSTINDLVQFSKKMGMTYKDLKLLNPWLRDKSLPNEQHKVYSIKILK